MNSKDSMFEMLSEQEQELLSAYFDGELSGGRLAKVERWLEQEERFQLAYQELESLGNSVAGWCSAQAESYRGALWPKMAAEFERAENEESWWQKFFAPVVLPSMGAVAALFFVTILNDGQEAAQNNAATVFASRSAEAPLLRPAATEFEVTPLRVPDHAKERLQRVLLRSQVRRPSVPVQEIMDSDFVRGGLRSNGVDIHWVKSGGKLRVFSAPDRAAPPVLWVSKGREAIDARSLAREFQPHELN